MSDRITKGAMLVVDDTEINRSIIRDIFKSDFTVYDAANGIEALELLRGGAIKFDVVILDIQMPEMDGFATLTEMRRLGILDETPVVAMTSEESAINDLNAIDFGAYDVISKPFSNVLIKKRVGNVIDGFLYRKSKA